MIPQKYLIKPIADIQYLEDIRQDFLDNHHDICTPMSDGNGCFYCPVFESNDGLEVMLCVISEAIPYLSEIDKEDLINEKPNNFKSEFEQEII